MKHAIDLSCKHVLDEAVSVARKQNFVRVLRVRVPTGTGPWRVLRMVKDPHPYGPAPVVPVPWADLRGRTGTGRPAYGYGAAPYPQSALTATALCVNFVRKAEPAAPCSFFDCRFVLDFVSCFCFYFIQFFFEKKIIFRIFFS